MKRHQTLIIHTAAHVTVPYTTHPARQETAVQQQRRFSSTVSKSDFMPRLQKMNINHCSILHTTDVWRVSRLVHTAYTAVKSFSHHEFYTILTPFEGFNGRKRVLELFHCVLKAAPSMLITLSVWMVLKVVLESRPVLMLSMRNTDCGPQSISPGTRRGSTATREDTLNRHEQKLPKREDLYQSRDILERFCVRGSSTGPANDLRQDLCMKETC